MLYECPGDIPMSNHQLNQLRAEKYPEEVISVISKFISSDAQPDCWKTTYNGYSTFLPKAILIEDVSDFKKLIFKLADVVDGIKLADIVALKYGIYSFNDSKANVESYFNNNSKYRDFDTNLYSAILVITLKDKRYNLALNYHRFWSSRKTKRGDTHDRNYGRDTFPDLMLSIFDEDTRVIGNTLIVDEFVKMCRNNIKK